MLVSAVTIPLLIIVVLFFAFKGGGAPEARDDSQSLEAIRETAKQGEAAFHKWNQNEGDQAAFDEAMSKLQTSVDKLTQILYDPKGPYVDPQDPEYLKGEFEGYEKELQHWGQLVHDLLKRRKR
ncbi:MAG: hypothetical protein KDD82_01125 [Planctomycetes bacterium]|nr:hypothetical protein [Planctomycetota bacterium]